MKYAVIANAVPPHEREATNHRIVHHILSGHTRELSPESVYNQFTGKGGLHGLRFADFSSHHAYSNAKKAVEHGQFFTPDALCADIVRAIRPPIHFRIADITCGIGNFYNHLPVESNVYGNELDPDAFEVCRYLFPEAHLENKDFRQYEPGQRMDLILGNPPFNIQLEEGSSQFLFVRKACELLTYGGLLAFIVPVSFLADEFQDGKKIEWINAHFNFVVQCILPANSFDARIDTKFVVLQKKGVTNSNLPYLPGDTTPFDPHVLFNERIAPLLEQYEQDRYRRRLYTTRQETPSKDIPYLIRRRLWHIKEHPALSARYYPLALRELEKLRTQKKPDRMNWEEWEKKRLTPEKVLHLLEAIIHRQDLPRPRRIVRLVKTSYGVRYKAYHPALKKRDQRLSIHDILTGNYNLKEYSRHILRKKKALNIQNTPFTALDRCPKADAWLDGVSLVPAEKPGLLFQPDDIPTIVPNAMQKRDLGLLFQKRYDILAWEQGGGKSVAGMLWIRYHQEQVRNCFLVGPAIAITGTWELKLEDYGFDHMTLERISDIDRIRPGQVVLVSYDKLIELRRFIKRYIRRVSYKVSLLVDESDELTNPASQRSRAAVDCFRKARYKLLTTGTTTRNSINELYTQLELLYNNSTAFLCEAERSYHVDDEGEVVERNNSNYGRPFPAYHGSGVFRSCFCPVKSTVFGIQKENQDVYNDAILRALVSKTIITRKFEEIVGEKKHSMHRHSIRQNPAEKALYERLMKDFMAVCYDYYTSTGNSRKDAGLRLVRQMQVLIKATSIPHLMKNYDSQEAPAKCAAIRRLVKSWPGELVTIGTTVKNAAVYYLTYLAKAFPNRKLFYIDGDITVTARRKLLLQFKASRNGILVATQQSLKSSVNIPYCNKCIVESLQWNIPKISQFYFRFIRFDSVRHTEVHFVNYQETIEVNLMALLMAKERLNDFIKTTNRTTSDAIYEQFGFDIGILDSLIQKEYDKEGHLRLTWGQQRIAA
jgi:predicted RNA methylase